MKSRVCSLASALLAAAGFPFCASAQMVGDAGFDASGKPDVARPYGTAVEPTRADRPLITDEEIVAAKMAGQDAILAQVISRAPAVEGGSTPNYHYVRSMKVAKRLRADEIGLKMDRSGTKQEVIDAAVAAAKAAGLPVAQSGHGAISDWAFIKLNKPVSGSAAMYSMIEQALKSPTIRVASPVFMNAFIDGGFYMPTDEVLARVKPGRGVDATLGQYARDFTVSNPKLGSMDRAVTLRSGLRNGFEILRRANELQESGAFEWSTPATLETMEHHVVTPNDSLFLNNQWVHRNTGIDWYSGSSLVYDGLVDFDMDTDQAWDITTGRSSVRVLVLDSGVQTTQPDLTWYSGRDFTTGVVAGVGDGSPGNSCDNHGTSVAGCAAALIGNSIGVAGTGGACAIMSGKIGDQVVPCGSAFSAYSNAWLVNAIDWGRDNGAKVTNASIGVGQDAAVEAMYTDTWNSGLLHFASAGNGSTGSSGFPGSSANTISVIAVDPDGTISSFSNWGTNCDLCAGGTVVFTTDRTGTDGYNASTTASGGDYTQFSGTSAASPLAAGVGLLFFSQHGFATPSQARTAIFNTCVDIGAAGIDNTYQRGHINAYGALTANSPSNDDCSTPNIISANGGNVSYRWVQDTTWATPSRLEPDPTCIGTDQNSVFFRFTADHDGTVVAHTVGSAYDTVLSAFDGCPTFNANGDLTGSPTQLACNDDFSGANTSQITFVLKAGQTAIIRASKYGSTSGGGTLDFNFSFNYSTPANDFCGNAYVIPDAETGSFTYTPDVYDIFFATTSSCEPQESCGTTPNSRSVYYKFVPEHDGTIAVDTFGSSYDTVLSIHSGCGLTLAPPLSGCIQPTRYACNDDANGGRQSSIADFEVLAGATYVIEVAQYGTSATNTARNLDFNFLYSRGIPSNNICTTPIVVPGTNTSGGITNYANTQDTYYATGSACDPLPGCRPAGTTANHTVWYSFTPDLDGAINVSTSGSGYDTVLTIESGCRSVFLGGCIGTSVQQRCSDNVSLFNLTSQILNFPVTAGTTYLFMVGANNTFTAASNPTLNFYLQYGADLCSADYNGDGAVDGDDVIVFFADWDAANAGADINGDGSVDGDDVIVFFSAWDSGC